jgi:hypothetical protein
MRKKWFLLAPLMIALFIFVGGEVVLHLWNWVLPALLGWREITFWQAVGILALCRILFGNFGGRPMWRSDFRRRMSQRWENMTPEEREKFRQGMRSGCGNFGARATETKGQA